jgi:hypothetical protein
MDRVIRTLLIALLPKAAVTGAVYAQYTPGGYHDRNYLQRICTDGRSASAHYIIVVSDSHAAFVDRGVTPSICKPNGVTITQTTDVVCKYLADNPQDRHLQAASLVVFSLEAAFPCRN